MISHHACLLSTHFRQSNPLDSQSGEPSKNELKKRAKAAEKEKKAAEKAAKLAEQQREKAAAEEVRHLSPKSRYPPLNGGLI
jgi:molecular chaperone DnaK (HSP70)